MTLRLEDLTTPERAQFESAVAEGDSGTCEWVTLMWMITINSGGNGDAYERRQGIRRLYLSEIEQRRKAGN